jgi:hypothetical protein
MARAAFPVLVFLLACSGGEGGVEATQDVKVDHNQKEDPVESIGPRSCFSDGRLYVVWADDRGGTSNIWFNASSDGGANWMPSDVRLNHGEAAAYAPDIGCSGTSVYVAWEDERDGDLRYRNIYGNVSTTGGRDWLEEDLLLDGDVEGDAMSLGPRVVAAGDSAYVAWFDARNGAYDIFLQATDDQGATWLDEPTRVDTDDAGSAYSASPRLAGDADGRVVVVWEDSRGGASDIYANVSSDHGREFGSDVRLDTGDEEGENDSFLPSIAMAGDNVYVVWHDVRNGENRDVFLSASNDGGESWSEEPARADSDAAGQSDSLNPVVAAVDDRAHVVWQDARSGGYDIYHRVSRDGGASWDAEEKRMDTDAGGESQSYEPVVLARGETVLVGWQDRRADAENVGFNDLYYNFSQNGGTNWNGEDLRINSNALGSAYAVDLSLALNGGEFIAVWADGRFGTSDVFAASRALGEESVYIAPDPEAEE